MPDDPNNQCADEGLKMRLLVLFLALLCLIPASVVCAEEYTLFGSGEVAIGAPAVYSALSFDPFASSRLTGFWGNPAYGTFADPDRPGPINVYDGADGTNVTLRLWFIGVDLAGIAPMSIGLLGAANVGQPDPCHATHAVSWAYYWPNSGSRAYGFKTVQMDAFGNIGFGPARGWNPSFAGIPSENVFDVCIEFVPVGSTGELRLYGFEKRYYSTDTFHFRPGRWIPNHYAWGLGLTELYPAIKDPTGMGPQNRYYNRFSGYPYAQQMNVFTGIQTMSMLTGTPSGAPTDHFSWAEIKAEGTASGANQVNSIAGTKNATLSGVYDLGEARITADFRSNENLIYVRQLNGSSGIGVRPAEVTLPETINVGDRVHVTGYTQIEDGSEVIVVAKQFAIYPADPPDPPLKPIGLSGYASGGGQSGQQKGVENDAFSSPTVYSKGLNTIGQLVKMWGHITKTGELQHNGAKDVLWLDDGSKLRDGFSNDPEATGIAVVLPSGWTGPPPTGYCTVTGILRAVSNPQGRTVRMLLTRYPLDIVQID